MAFSCWQRGRAQGDAYVSHVCLEAADNRDQPEVLTR